MFITITALYAGLLALLVLFLALRIPPLRMKKRVGLGDGGDSQLRRAIRMHGNAVEYIPLGLILLMVLETSGASLWILHAVGGSLLLGRILHAIGLARSEGSSVWRGAGMLLTVFSILGAALYCLLIAVSSF